jgi:uncharacterized membrane protein YkvA (DUF1232 family)
MDIIIYALLGILVTVLMLLIAAWFIMRRLRRDVRALADRVNKLPFRSKIALAGVLMRDERIPTGLRMLPPLLILYLALPLDLIPDFIPVIGQIDDVAVLLVGGALMLRFAPIGVLEERVAQLEQASYRNRAAA